MQSLIRSKSAGVTGERGTAGAGPGRDLHYSPVRAYRCSRAVPLIFEVWSCVKLGVIGFWHVCLYACRPQLLGLTCAQCLNAISMQQVGQCFDCIVVGCLTPILWTSMGLLPPIAQDATARGPWCL